MSNKLYTLYQNILDFAGFRVEDDGKLLVTLNGREFPADIDGKQMMFPYDTALKKFEPEKHVIFHPLQEFINRGESDVVRKLRRVINIRLNLATLSMIDGLMMILSSPALHAKMNPQQRELIKSVDHVDEVLRGKFMSASTGAFGDNPDALFLNIYTKKSGTFKGERHARVGVVTFPIFDAVPDAFKKFKDADWKKILQIMEFIFPGEDEKEAYNGFSDSTDCPWLDCLLRTSINLTGRLNELWDLYGKFIDEENMIRFNMDWVDGFDNLQAYKKEIMMIPSQRGNEGESELHAKPSASTAPAMAMPASALNASPAPAPVQQTPAPAPVATPQVQPAQPNKPIWGDAVQPAYPQMPGMSATAPVTPPPRKDNGKVSFDSLATNNPMVTMPTPFNSPIVAAQQNAQMLAYQAAMMNSPSMAAMAGVMPGMAPGMMPPMQMGYPQQPQYPQYQQYPQQNMGYQLDPWGRPIMPGGIQGV